jgi:putative endonuclease
MDRRHRLGAWGEDLARLFLEHCGYRLLESRFRRGGGEIDLVMVRGGRVVFVEVKTRGPGALDDPAAWVGPLKRARLRRTARRWLAENPGRAPGGCRIDVVAVRWEGSEAGASLVHLAGVG